MIEAGVNDWFSSRTGFRARYAAALAALPLSRPVIAAAILPVDGDEVWRVYDGDYDFRGANASSRAGTARSSRYAPPGRTAHSSPRQPRC